MMKKCDKFNTEKQRKEKKKWEDNEVFFLTWRKRLLPSFSTKKNKKNQMEKEILE